MSQVESSIQRVADTYGMRSRFSVLPTGLVVLGHDDTIAITLNSRARFIVATSKRNLTHELGVPTRVVVRERGSRKARGRGAWLAP